MLRLANVTRTYPNGVRALDGVTLDIPNGMFGLLGPNGAGKSSLMRTIATLQRPDEGSISFGDGPDAINVLEDQMSLRSTLGYLPQDFGSYPRVSPKRMLDHLAVLKGIKSAGERRDVVEALLHQTNLWDVRDRAIDTFSGGMRQRFGIAQALIGNPGLIIVDEPTAGLDPAERRRFHRLLARIGRDVVIILSTHIVEDVSDLCPRVAIMGRGRILESGAPRDLVARYQGRLWKKQVDDETSAEGLHVISATMSEGRTQLRVLSDEQPQGFEPAQPDLEDVYFATLDAHGVEAAA